MRRIICSLIVAVAPLGSVFADTPKSESENVKMTLVYRHELPNVPGKSIKGVSANAGDPAPAKLPAVFVMGTNETELTIPFGN